MQSLLLGSRIAEFSILSKNLRKSVFTLNQSRNISHTSQAAFSKHLLSYDHTFQTNRKISLFGPALIKPNFPTMTSLNKGHKNLIFRSVSTTNAPYKADENKTEKEKKDEKKPSKFKQLYSQYGPLFVVVHLITVVMWIYGFFLISKQLVII